MSNHDGRNLKISKKDQGSVSAANEASNRPVFFGWFRGPPCSHPTTFRSPWKFTRPWTRILQFWHHSPKVASYWTIFKLRSAATQKRFASGPRPTRCPSQAPTLGATTLHWTHPSGPWECSTLHQTPWTFILYSMSSPCAPLSRWVLSREADDSVRALSLWSV